MWMVLISLPLEADPYCRTNAPTHLPISINSSSYRLDALSVHFHYNRSPDQRMPISDLFEGPDCATESKFTIECYRASIFCLSYSVFDVGLDGQYYECEML